MCDIGITPENFNPRALYMVKSKYNDQSKTTYHSHDFISLIYILSGSCTYTINNVLYRVNTGDIVIANSGVSHGKIIAPGEEVTEFHIGFDNICIKSLSRDCLIGDDVNPVMSFPKFEDDFLSCCSEILLEQENVGPGSELILKALVMKFIGLYIKARHAGDEYPVRRDISVEPYDKASMVKAIISYIDENYMQDISLDKIAKNMYLSPIYISKIFKEETGESPINYLIKIRLSKAKRVIEEEHLSVKSAAKSVGYNDAYYFSKLYKKYYGYPPSKCRVR